MPPIFGKLNLKSQPEILVVNAPLSFEPELAQLQGVTVVRDVKKAKAVHFALVFATKQTEVDTLSKALAGTPSSISNSSFMTGPSLWNPAKAPHSGRGTA